ncbi:MAG: hypothetical protein ACK502_06770 [Alphaproteobacteria bacterium]
MKTNNTLESLNIYKTGAGAEGARAIADALCVNQTLSKLEINRNYIGDEGARAMAHMLENNHGLITLDIGLNDITDSGAKSLTNALYNNNTLLEIDFNCARFGEEAIEAMAALIAANKAPLYLDIRGNFAPMPGLEKIAKALESNDTMLNLDISNMWPEQVLESYIDSFAAGLRTNRTLASINIDGTNPRYKTFSRIDNALLDSKNYVDDHSGFKKFTVCDANKNAAKRLLDKMRKSPDKLSLGDIDEIKERSQAIIFLITRYNISRDGVIETVGLFAAAQDRARELGTEIKLPAYWQKRIDAFKEPVTRSNKPYPLKADRTLTLARLQETKADGRTNLQIFAEQGQLGDVFTAEIWQGRKDEMDKAWQLVKPQHQNQVNIELVRQQIDAFNLRDRFRRDGDDVAQGF